MKFRLTCALYISLLEPYVPASLLGKKQCFVIREINLVQFAFIIRIPNEIRLFVLVFRLLFVRFLSLHPFALIFTVVFDLLRFRVNFPLIIVDPADLENI